MPNTFFQFKQFIIHQQRSAMKVCTDSCLFGALLPSDKNITTALDIGAGTGLLSLMYAQKNDKAIIDAVELNTDAALEANENFALSKWKQRLTVHHSDIIEFAEKSNKKYDIIFSNPPFYENELLSPTENINTAHHSTQLTLQQLVSAAEKLLKPDGIFAVLLPYFRQEYFTEICSSEYGMYPYQKFSVKQSPHHDYFRSIIFFSRNRKGCREEEIIIKEMDGNYSENFITLLKEYYLYL